ncbi:hypothetical protein CLRAG_33320 [Clostridium ragsdalei P11]|uniref:Uncharacterized protein n=1 Tax=Clostridium ragsdalei P11 TaxID=1353534 RepID=A0A1A6AKS9_9CLOT|nr:hypothetical protein CLRAG_33320 [Clostridium ragsdalei P11]
MNNNNIETNNKSENLVYPMTTRSNTPTSASGSKERLRPWITIFPKG